MAPPSAQTKAATLALGLSLLLTSARPGATTQFLARFPDGASADMIGPDYECNLRSEIEVIFGVEFRNFMHDRLPRIEESMSKAYAAVAKNQYGRLGDAAASYVLHRVLLQRHAWSVQGLDPAGSSMSALSSSTVVGVLQGRVPKRALDLFEQCVGGRGLGLQELAILAATLEHLVYQEASQRLEAAYESLDLLPTDTLNLSEVEIVMDSYMAFYLLGSLTGNVSYMNGETVQWARAVVEHVYPSWNQTEKFIRDVQHRVAADQKDMRFSDVLGVADAIGEVYGRWQDEECRTMKDMLVKFEDTSVGGAGRVRLADFYQKGLHDGAWQFGESINSLRNMGAIDDSHPTDLRVIIPNYVYSPANCVAGSAFYSVCCIDECNELLADLEREFGEPELSPEQIASHVAALSSSTVSANRTLPAWLLGRLDHVAAHHGGRVPLHGRLFLQWMHHAYPRECRYPHVSGTTEPSKTLVTVYNFEDNHATEEEMESCIDSSRDAALTQTEEGRMWTMEEELFVLRAALPVRGAAVPFTALRAAVLVGVLASMLVAGVNRGLKLEAFSGQARMFSKSYV